MKLSNINYQFLIIILFFNLSPNFLNNAYSADLKRQKKIHNKSQIKDKINSYNKLNQAKKELKNDEIDYFNEDDLLENIMEIDEWFEGDDDLESNKDDSLKIKEESPKINDQQNQTRLQDINISDFGVLRVVIENKNAQKKYDTDESQIFLNPQIFDVKENEKIKNLETPEKPNQKSVFSINHRLVNDLSFANNFSNPRNNFQDTTGVVRFSTNLEYKNFKLFSILRFARIDNNRDIERRLNDPAGGGSRSFDNFGATLPELNLKYSLGNNSIIAGKFTSNFGTAWRWNQGVFIHNIASNYGLFEKLGFAFVSKYGDIKKTGLYNFSFSTFTNDRKNFDNSVFHRREGDGKSKAIAGDTRSLKSYTLATDINFEFAENERLSYHLAYANLAINKEMSPIKNAKIKNQNGYVFGVNYIFPIIKKLNAETLIEYTRISNINGNTDISNKFLTTNLIFKYNKKYSLMFGNSKNKIKNKLISRSYDNSNEINFGYEFDKTKFYDKITAQIVYHQLTIKSPNQNQTNKSWAILLRYIKNF